MIIRVVNKGEVFHRTSVNFCKHSIKNGQLAISYGHDSGNVRSFQEFNLPAQICIKDDRDEEWQVFHYGKESCNCVADPPSREYNVSETIPKF